MKLGRPGPKASVREPLGGFTVKRVFVYLALVLVGGGAVVRLGRVRLRESNGEASRGTKSVQQ